MTSSNEQLAAAALALARGDPLFALRALVAREDPMARALRGIALAQVEEFDAALVELRAARARFEGLGARHRAARCLAAEVEITARTSADLERVVLDLERAEHLLQQLGERGNREWLAVVRARTLVLLGRLDRAEEILAELDRVMGDADPVAASVARLARAELALRARQAARAEEHVRRAERLSGLANNRLLTAEVERARDALARPVARVSVRGGETLSTMSELEAILASPPQDSVVVDGLARRISSGSAPMFSGLERRPVLFDILATLAMAHPHPLHRRELIAKAFGVRTVNESHEARLRVELGRLRTALRDAPAIRVRTEGSRFVLDLPPGFEAYVILPLSRGAIEAVAALLSDGRAWKAESLAASIGKSARTVQRALSRLQEEQRARALGRGRSAVWAAVGLGETIATQMLLLGAVGDT